MKMITNVLNEFIEDGLVSVTTLAGDGIDEVYKLLFFDG
jgi:DNA-binding HxlR family transcriptional regulator